VEPADIFLAVEVMALKRDEIPDANRTHTEEIVAK